LLPLSNPPLPFFYIPPHSLIFYSFLRYDLVLVEGLPDWKQPLFYYRRMRKMGLVEMGVLLLIMASVGHYLYGWAVFAEKQIVLVIL
jgi:DnaJ family protein C protein 1